MITVRGGNQPCEVQELKYMVEEELEDLLTSQTV